jgi:hypothetical protein
MLTSIGTISSSYAVVADIASPAERGFYVGVFLCGYVEWARTKTQTM